MADCPVTIHALNVYCNSLQRISLDQQQLFNDLIVCILQVECAGAPQGLTHSASMPSAHVVYTTVPSNNLAVTNPVSDFSIFGGTTQHVSATSSSSTFSQPGGTTQRDPVPEPSSTTIQPSRYHHTDNDDSSTVQLGKEYTDNVVSQWQDDAPSALASPAKPSLMEGLEDERSCRSDSSDDEDDDQQGDFSMIFHHRPDSRDGNFVSVDWEDLRSTREQK
ncbi:hypothetical protein QM012_002058 [Aureobasidium pullulans]|uniref:Uncharacterized protein n=1 Tax=Aureobasidium pullulans TaxID=5580 RepID=A0ABR0TEP5_AURPU